MPPRASNRDSDASGSLNNNNNTGNGNGNGNSGISGNLASSSTRSNNKSKQLALKQAQEEFLARHIHSNGPQDKESPDPLDFEHWDNRTLNKYRVKYNLIQDIPAPMSSYGSMLSTDKTFTERSQEQRASKSDVANAIKEHFLNQNVKESEVISNFLYAVKNEEKTFKMPL